MTGNFNFSKFSRGLKTFLRGRNFASGLLVALIIAAVILVNVICYTLTEYFELYLYQPESPDFTLSDTFAELFEEKKQDGKTVTVTFCMSNDDLKAHSTGSYVRETALKFAEKYEGFINLRFVNLITMYDQAGNDVSEELEFYTEYLEKNKGTYGNADKLNKTSVIFRSDDNFKIVTDTSTGVGFGDFYTLDSSKYVTSYNGEETFAAMTGWVLRDRHGMAYFTTGHGESPNQTLVTALSCAGYEIGTINLRDSTVSGEDMMKKLDDTDLIVIANPTSDFEKAADSSVVAELSWLDYYARGGGNLFITLDPYYTKLTNLYSFVDGYGISLLTTEDGQRQTVQDMDNGITTDGFTIVAEFGDGEIPTAMKSNLPANGGIILRDVSPLKLASDGAAKPLLVTSASSVCYAGGKTTDTSGTYTIAAYAQKTSDTGNESRLFFIPSVYLTATDAMVTRGYSNKDFVYSLFDEFYGMGDMPYGTNSIVYDSQVLENLTMGTARLYTAIILAVPAALAVLCAVILIRRKNR